MRRFYKEVAILASPLEREAEKSAQRIFRWGVLLDGKPIKTPRRAALELPTRALADAVAEEWRAQGAKIEPHIMHLTKFANTAIDRVVGHEVDIADQILAYANDLLCYRAEGPDDLAARQNELWNPLLDWAGEHYAPLNIAAGIGYILQPEESLTAFRRALGAYDAFALTVIHSAATICGSLILALALAEGRLNAADAFALSQLDERYQAEKWGMDGEAEKRARALAAELAAAARFLALART